MSSQAKAGSVVRSDSGANTAAIQATVDQFRTDLGSHNANVAGSFLTGRREINWDGVPDTSAAPNNLPADFFNVTSPRGVLFSTPGTGFRVSADSSNSTGTPVQFGDIDPNYPILFEPFSTERLFTPIGSNITDVTFVVPGTSIPASVNGFGVVFSDVDATNMTSLQFFDAAGNSLGSFFAPTVSGSETYSFVGVSFDAGERVARVRITCGNQVLAAGNLSSDLVVMDDFIYGEPVPYPDVIAVDNSTSALLRFNARTPETIVGNYPVNGLAAGENLVGIDYRPATGQLYGLIHNGSNTARLVTMPFTGGTPTMVGNSFFLNGGAIGFGFNATNDRIRVTTDFDENLSVNPTNAVPTVQGALNPGNPTLVGAAYTNSVVGATTTTLFGIDSVSDMLVTMVPATGTLTNIGALGFNTSAALGFDIQGHTNTGYATLTASSVSRLFSVDLDDGLARQIGAALPAPVTAMALVPQVPTVVTPLNTELLGIGVNNNLFRFNSDTPANLTMISVTGLGAGETLHGIDVRPANQTVYALGITNGPGTNDSEGRIYTIDLDTGAATQVGNAPFSNALVDNAIYGFDFNPATDRIRIVNSFDQNMRVNPNSGFLVQFDFDLDNTAGGETIGAVAYDRPDNDPATGTTLFAINAATNTLDLMGSVDNAPQSANTGVLNRIGPLGTALFTSTGGFDIAPSGHGFAALRVGTSFSLYSIDLLSGTAISRGLILNGTLTVRGLTVLPEPCTITCPSAVNVSTAPNQCSATVNYPPPTSTCVFTTAPASGSTFPKGDTTVTASTGGNTASCTFLVRVFDPQPPTLVCPANVTVQAAPGASGATVTFPGPTATDNCPGFGAPQSTPPSGSFFPIGTTTVVNSVVDESGNVATCGFTVTVTPGPTPTPTPTPTPFGGSTLANISTRLRVETADNVLIGGFIVTGTQDKKVIIRAIGPSLGLPDKLENPTLELRDSTGTLLQENDDWIDSPNKQAIIDSTIPPANDFEAAIVATLPANGSAFTAIVAGANNTTGIGVVEIYDLDQTVDSKLANISTRGFVQTGDTVLIAGMIVLGQVTQKVIVRAIGPSLNVNGKLLDPTLELRNANGDVVRANNDWRTDQEAEIMATTIPPSSDAEAALVETLAGNGASYTAIVRGVNDTTGIALVEVYALP